MRYHTESLANVKVKTSAALHPLMESANSPERAVRLVRHSPPFANPGWLFPALFFLNTDTFWIEILCLYFWGACGGAYH